jgi:hypothetical protein
MQGDGSRGSTSTRPSTSAFRNEGVLGGAPRSAIIRARMAFTIRLTQAHGGGSLICNVRPFRSRCARLICRVRPGDSIRTSCASPGEDLGMGCAHSRTPPASWWPPRSRPSPLMRPANQSPSIPQNPQSLRPYGRCSPRQRRLPNGALPSPRSEAIPKRPYDVPPRPMWCDMRRSTQCGTDWSPPFVTRIGEYGALPMMCFAPSDEGRTNARLATCSAGHPALARWDDAGLSYRSRQAVTRNRSLPGARRGCAFAREYSSAPGAAHRHTRVRARTRTSAAGSLRRAGSRPLA